MELNTIYNEDCLEGMKRIPDKSVDMILCDLPYGTTACAWDEIIPFEPLWEQYERVIKDNGAIVLTASQPFTTDLINSKRELFKYCWVWDKRKATGGTVAKYRPMKAHEDIVVFSKGKTNYYPQLEEYTEKEIKRMRYKDVIVKNAEVISKGVNVARGRESATKKSPRSLIRINAVAPRSEEKQKWKHPTQKPVALFEYLVKTYTNKGETVLDNCMGSGTTAIACLNTDRQYIGFELDETYHKLSLERIKNHTQQLSLI